MQHESKSTGSRRSSRWRVHLAWLLVVVVVGAVAFWGARVFTAPAATEEMAEVAAPATVTATVGEVGDSITANGFVSFDQGLTLFSGVSGVVTALSVDPQVPVQSGTVVATVALSPVVVAEGGTPAFRDLVEGDRGPDVAQLQALVGVSGGDGVFGPGTRRAVLAWKRSLGMRNPDARVPLGMVVFVPSLPVRVVPAEGVVVGSSVAAGEALLVTLQERPAVTVPVDVAPRVQSGMPASVQAGAQTLTGRVGEVTLVEGVRRYVIVGEDGEGICGAECAAQFPAEGETPVQVQVEVSPVASGVVVPSAAVGVQPDGSRVVRTPDGELIPVQVDAEAGGMSVVTGIEEGTEVLLFADQQ